ncbi:MULTISPECIES: helix-turn-helix domain-containing protein [Megamonas]|jgi:transcriptional regulator with XRE-family HTH domain|uniref:Helix-turn-helix transcriptional regulator n=2 Tax=Megamonas funiformis TaxID=437897 RepID=A0AAW4U429_9FIRM|nr:MULTISPECIES: helix-turn-helix transcriptional regulator [Megamonas]MCB6827988.1 helix-turn-helix transcriptional regulator [Megamonas funiformis]
MNNMKKIRESLQLTQVKVANDLKLSRQVYNFYENGKRNPDMQTLIKIADYYGVSIDYLLGRTNVIKPENIDEDDLLSKINTADSETKASVEQFLNYLLYEKERKNKEKNDNNAKKNTDNEIAI